MKNKRYSAQILRFHANLLSFFLSIPGYFNGKDKQGRLIFVKKFPQKNLQITVTTPYTFSKNNDIGGLENGLRIRFSIQDSGKTCLTLRDSRMINGWEKIASKKMQALFNMIVDIPECPQCHRFHLRPIQRKEAQANPRGTNFVQYECPKTGYVINSNFGAGIKSALHPFLIKK